MEWMGGGGRCRVDTTSSLPRCPARTRSGVGTPQATMRRNQMTTHTHTHNTTPHTPRTPTGHTRFFAAITPLLPNAWRVPVVEVGPLLLTFEMTMCGMDRYI